MCGILSFAAAGSEFPKRIFVCGRHMNRITYLKEGFFFTLKVMSDVGLTANKMHKNVLHAFQMASPHKSYAGVTTNQLAIWQQTERLLPLQSQACYRTSLLRDSSAHDLYCSCITSPCLVRHMLL